MKTSKYMQVGIWLAIILLWLVSVYEGRSLLSGLDRLHGSKGAETAGIPNGENSKIAKAFAIQKPASFFRFQGSSRPPFNLPQEQQSGKKAGADVVRSKLVLNGVLLKERPLAILADQAGNTAICAVGDTFNCQTVIAIRTDGITLKDKKGQYELSVVEK